MVGCFFFFKQKTAYEMRISDWSSDVCSSDLPPLGPAFGDREAVAAVVEDRRSLVREEIGGIDPEPFEEEMHVAAKETLRRVADRLARRERRSEEQPYELQSLMGSS